METIHSKHKKHKLLKAISVLFLFGFALSSCKGCPEFFERIDVDISKSEVGKYLKARGAGNAEIREMLKIEKEDFGENIERIVYENNHYYYRGHDNGWTRKNCGLYAMKRMLFVLGKHDEIDKNLWYKYTDSELREMDVGPNQDNDIFVGQLRTLMEDLGIPPKYREIHSRTGGELVGIDGGTINEHIAHYTAMVDLVSGDPLVNLDTKLFYSNTKKWWENRKIEHDKKMNRLLSR
ncbi:hypothetical protein AGMMS49593_09320 [Endomicrobiia bacterium]|nr:hypothetical protein AGMMS49593_09320 [Endomicrobiia bacterium]